MSSNPFTQGYWQKQLDYFRLRLAHVDALPQLSILGLVAGIGTGLFIVGFRHCIELPLGTMLPGNDENFEGLPVWMCILLPIAGALCLGLLFHFFDRRFYPVGVNHVIERLQHHQGRLPLRNMVVQFFGGVMALCSGFSVGREGPAVHLGAASSSLMGQWLRLPNNSLRVLVGSGAAAAIAASFNTPIAGVIFAMEVILVDYTITSFIPVILAAVSATVISMIFYGSDPAFEVPVVSGLSLNELPLVIVFGFAIGAMASLFLYLQRFFHLANHKPVFQRFLVAGVITGLLAGICPGIMGIGYDTVNQALLGQLPLLFLLVLVATKLLATATAIGLGIPGGLIGASLVLGACLGATAAISGQPFFSSSLNSSSYAVIGMAAMMSAVINAPLAALMAAMELTWSPHIILPAMLAIVIANITTTSIFRQRSAFDQTIASRQRHQNLLFHILQRAGVTSIMQTNLASHARQISLEKARELLQGKPAWIVIEDVGEEKTLLNPADLARFIETHSATLMAEGDDIDLERIPGERYDMASIHPRANLAEAMQFMHQKKLSALYIQTTSAPLISNVAGIITEQDLRNYYAPAATSTTDTGNDKP
jgi:CIC family chloride channel protein